MWFLPFFEEREEEDFFGFEGWWDGNIRKQDMVDNGQIAAVLIEDMEAEATLKRVYYNPEEGELRLVPENPKEWTKVFRGEELNSIRILGLAVGLTRSLEDK